MADKYAIIELDRKRLLAFTVRAQIEVEQLCGGWWQHVILNESVTTFRNMLFAALRGGDKTLQDDGQEPLTLTQVEEWMEDHGVDTIRPALWEALIRMNRRLTEDEVKNALARAMSALTGATGTASPANTADSLTPSSTTGSSPDSLTK